MNSKVSVVIRNKNQGNSLKFLLKNLRERYDEDIAEIIVLDNLSSDESQSITTSYGARFISIKNFSYGGSANLAAACAEQEIIVMFSAHSYPVSHDFFKQIILRFHNNKNLAGVRCIHNPNDFQNFINGVTSSENPDTAGLIFCGSAFSRKVWEEVKFNDGIRTFEDKEWTLRVLKKGFDIELSPSIFCYQIKRSKKDLFFRYKNEVVGSYQLWHHNITFSTALKSLFGYTAIITRNYFVDMFYGIKRFFFLCSFITNKPKKFNHL